MSTPIPGLDPGLQIGGNNDPADPNAPPFFPNLQGGTILNLQGGVLLNHSGIGFNLAKIKQKPPAWRMLPPYTENWTETETEVQATWNGPWSTLASFRNWMLGYSTSVTTPDGRNLLLRTPPAQHPKHPWLYCTTCELVDGDGAWLPDKTAVATDANGAVLINPATGDPFLNEMIAFANNLGSQTVFDPGGVNPDTLTRFGDGVARCRVTYHALPYEVRDDNDPRVQQLGELARYVEREWEPAIQALPIAGQLAQTVIFNDTSNPVVPFPAGKDANGRPQTVQKALNGTAVPEAGVLLMPTRSCIWRWYHVPDVNWTAVASCEGKVNDAPFDGVPGFPTYPAGTLLCQSPTIRRTPRTPAGRVSFIIAYRLDFRPQGWNRVPWIDFNFYTFTFYDGSPVYKGADFTQLFAPPPPAQYQ
jgi:hypothetical protein